MDLRAPIVVLMTSGICALPSYGETFRVLPFEGNSLPSTERFSRKGKVVDGAHWLDKSGENLLLLTQTGVIPSKGSNQDNRSAEVHAYQYVKSPRGWREQWVLNDFERNCPYDLYAGFLPGSLEVSDLDGDGRAETTFLYKLTCRSDVSPSTLKLIMYEGKVKFAILGTTIVQTGPQSYSGGQKIVNSKLLRAPAIFRRHAQTQWKKFVNETKFDQF